jgi:formylglycine-generating enzyme required for sulfatase activity
MGGTTRAAAGGERRPAPPGAADAHGRLEELCRLGFESGYNAVPRCASARTQVSATATEPAFVQLRFAPGET